LSKKYPELLKVKEKDGDSETTVAAYVTILEKIKHDFGASMKLSEEQMFDETPLMTDEDLRD